MRKLRLKEFESFAHSHTANYCLSCCQASVLVVRCMTLRMENIISVTYKLCNFGQVLECLKPQLLLLENASNNRTYIRMFLGFP